MDFSVIMSVYKNDRPKFFKTAIESTTIQQTLKPRQVVIVEDGPVDETIDSIIKDLISSQSEIEFTVIKKENNEGLAAALNTAIDYCKYEWIARMDSDDYSVPNRFELQFKYVERHPEVAVIGGGMREFNNEMDDISSQRVVGETMNEIKTMMKTRNPMNHMTVCYKKSAVVDTGKYCISFGKLEDYKLWVDMIGKGYIFANIPDVVCYARVGSGFIERRSNKREIIDWDMLQMYLMQNGIINKFEAFRNKVYIRTFIYMPGWMKKLAYKLFLRR